MKIALSLLILWFGGVFIACVISSINDWLKPDRNERRRKRQGSEKENLERAS
jgi:hypothetical protein